MPKFAANLSTLFPELEFLDRFEAAARAGFSAVEIQFPYDHSAAAIRGYLEANGLRLVMFNLPAGDWGRGDRGLGCLVDRESEFRDGVERALDYARALDCRQLNCLSGVAPAGGDLDRILDTFVGNLRHAAARLAEWGMTLTIEPVNTRDVPGMFLAYSAQAKKLIEAVAAPNLKIQFDLYHAQVMEGDLAHRLTRLLPLIGHLQIADNPGRHEPGTGEVNFPFLFDHIDRLGYAGWIGCEYRPLGDTHKGLGWLAPYRAGAGVL